MNSVGIIGLAIVPMIVLAGWLAIIRKWRIGVYLLLSYMPYAGVVTLALYPSPFPTIFKDILFVIPLYMGAVLYIAHKESIEHNPRIPNYITILICLLVVLVLAQSLNPAAANWLVVAVGIKVWLFYLPMIFVGFALARNINDLVLPLRIMVVTAWVPCLIGIGELVASSYLGYEVVMISIYGDAAMAATQNFQTYDLSGQLLRIPSTFSYWVQYSGYTLAMIVVTYMLFRIDPIPAWRRFSMVSLVLCVIASFLSGAKANFVFVPLLIMITLILEGNVIRALVLGVITVFLFLGVLAVGNFDFMALFELMSRLLTKYYNEVVIGGLNQAVQEAPWGMGTGMNTGPARHALKNYDYENISMIENYYAKSVYELGLVGLVLVLGVFLGIIAQGIKQHLKIKDERIKSCSAALLGFIIIIVVSSLKGWQIDIDPINVYFWLFAGILLRLRYLAQPWFYERASMLGH